MYVLSIRTGSYSDASTHVLGVYTTHENAMLASREAWNQLFPKTPIIHTQAWQQSEYRPLVWNQPVLFSPEDFIDSGCFEIQRFIVDREVPSIRQRATLASVVE